MTTLTLSPTTISSISNGSASDSYNTVEIKNAQYQLQESSKTSIYQDIFRILKSGGQVLLEKDLSDDESMGFLMAGFIIVSSRVVQKPEDQVQVGMKMSLKGKNVIPSQKWTLDDTNDYIHNVLGDMGYL